MDPSGLPLGARYMVDEHVGAGATGMVYLGHVRDDGTPVAIKILRPELAEDPDVVGRFVRERSIVVGVRHPNLVRTLDLVIDGGYAAIVMDWVGGGDLRDDLRTGGPMTEEDAARVLRQVLSALGAVHAAGVIHRDVKPANVLLDEDGRAHLSDFGIGRLVAGNSSTASSELVGTADYMAPELLRNERATPAVDVYSTGCMFHELLTGTPPFAAGSLAVILLAHLNEPAQRPAGISDPVWYLLSRMLAKDPAVRPTVPQAIAELDRMFPSLAAEETTVVAPAPVTVRVQRSPEPLAEPARPPARRRSRVALWVAAAALALGLTVTAALVFIPRLDTVAADGPVVPVVTSTETTSDATTTGTTTAARTTSKSVASETTAETTDETTTETTTAEAPPPVDPGPVDPGGSGEGNGGGDGGGNGGGGGDDGCPDGAGCETCPGGPTCPDPCQPEPPAAPTDAGWLSGAGDVPVWTAPPADDCHPEVLSYNVTLTDLTDGTSYYFTLYPGDNGVYDFYCLGNWHPEVEAYFRYDISAANEIGTSATTTSSDHLGQRC